MHVGHLVQQPLRAYHVVFWS